MVATFDERGDERSDGHAAAPHQPDARVSVTSPVVALDATVLRAMLEEALSLWSEPKIRSTTCAIGSVSVIGRRACCFVRKRSSASAALSWES